MRRDQEAAAKSPLRLQYREVACGMAPHACVRHPYHLLHSQEMFGTSQVFQDVGSHTERQNPPLRPSAGHFQRGRMHLQTGIHRRVYLECAASERIRQRGVKGLVGTPIRSFASRQGIEAQRCGWCVHCHRAHQCQSWGDATSQAVARHLALCPQAGDSPMQEGVGWDKHGRWLQTAQQWAQPSFVPV